MAPYHFKDWFIFVFRFRKEDTLRKLLPLIAGMALYTAIVAYLLLEVFELPQNARLRNLSQMHTLLSFVISLLLVFRTNSAYDRWYEGRRLWGSLFGQSRNFAIKLNAILDRDDESTRRFFKITIPLFAYGLHFHLRRQVMTAEFDKQMKPDIIGIDKAKQIPNQIASLIIKKIQQLYSEGKIKGDQLIILDTEIRSFTEISGACERIKNTPIPFSYSAFLNKFIFLYVMALPFSFVFLLGWGSIPVVVFIFFVLASLQMIAEEIEDPFGGDENDLPTLKVAEGIEQHMDEIFD